MYVILRLPKVKERTGLAKSTIYKKIAEGTFPPPIQISAKAVGWLECDVNRWFEKRIEESANDNYALNDNFRYPDC